MATYNALAKVVTRTPGSLTPMTALELAVPVPPVVVWYLMRAKRISTGLRVFWNSPNAPDLTGALSGFPGDVTEIVVLSPRG